MIDLLGELTQRISEWFSPEGSFEQQHWHGELLDGDVVEWTVRLGKVPNKLPDVLSAICNGSGSEKSACSSSLSLMISETASPTASAVLPSATAAVSRP
jgi:hypothetical protein